MRPRARQELRLPAGGAKVPMQTIVGRGPLALLLLLLLGTAVAGGSWSGKGALWGRNGVKRLISPVRLGGAALQRNWKNFGQQSRVAEFSMIRGGAKKAKTKRKKSKANAEEVAPMIFDSLHDTEAEDTDNGPPDSSTSDVVLYISNFIRSVPPITLAYLVSSVSITVLSFLLNKNQFPEVLTFTWSGIAHLQLWRLVTGFLFLGGVDLFYPLTLQFVHQHMAHLEKINYDSPEDFVMMLGFGIVSLLAVYSLTGISTRLLGHNLATYFVYIWSRVMEGLDVNFMDLFLMKAEYMPWFFCAQTYLLEQDVPVADLIGILVGHLYYFLKQKKALSAPRAIRAFFRTPFWRNQYGKFRGEFE